MQQYQSGGNSLCSKFPKEETQLRRTSKIDQCSLQRFLQSHISRATWPQEKECHGSHVDSSLRFPLLIFHPKQLLPWKQTMAILVVLPVTTKSVSQLDLLSSFWSSRSNKFKKFQFSTK